MILKIRRDSQLGGFKLQLLIIAMVFIQLAVGFSDLISASRVGGSYTDGSSPGSRSSTSCRHDQ